MRITGVQTTCGCFAAIEQMPIDLGPGESRDVEFLVEQELDDQQSYKQDATFFLDTPSPPVKLYIHVSRSPAGNEKRLASR